MGNIIRAVGESSGFGEPLVEHEVNEDAGDGDIKPEGECPAGPGAVFFEAAFDGVRHGHQNEGDDDDGQNDVGDEHSVVEGLQEAFAAEGGVDTLD